VTASGRHGAARERTTGRAALAALGCAALAAILYALASPPHGIALLAWAVPAILLAPLVGAPLRRAFAAGLVFGLGIAVGITSWAVHASLRYFDLDPIAATLFAFAVWTLAAGIPYGLFAAAFAWLSRRTSPLWQPFVAAWLWVTVEVLRSQPPLGLPWGFLSHTQWEQPAVIQIADLGGAYAVTFVIVLVSTSLGLLIRSLRSLRARGERAKPVSGLALSARLIPAALALAATLAYGAAVRSGRADDVGNQVRTAAVVQTDRATGFHWRRVEAERELLAYLRLTAELAPRQADLDLIVWPENAVYLYLDREPMVLARLRELATGAGSALLVGAPRLVDDQQARNAAHLIAPEGDLRGAYDKRVLLPFAEEELFPSTHAVAAEPRYGGGGTSAPLSASGATLGTTICWEVLFPPLVRDAVQRGAELLVNVSNDSWLNDGSGAAPEQHFAMAVFRAVEMRRFLVRASAGGMSGFVSPLGEVYATVEVGRAGGAVGRVELRDEVTPYARWGDAWIALAGLGVAAAWLFGHKQVAPC
jgi:apolipoprotein N-acyltransferase